MYIVLTLLTRNTNNNNNNNNNLSIKRLRNRKRKQGIGMEEKQSRGSKDGDKKKSDLYDYEEFQAMIGHINKATHFSPNLLSNHLINSPFYRQRLNQIYKQSSVGSTKRITCQGDLYSSLPSF